MKHIKKAIFLNIIFSVTMIIALSSINQFLLPPNIGAKAEITEINQILFDIESNKPKHSNGASAYIWIDATAEGVGANNWTWASTQPWYSFNGTHHIIENITLDLSISGYQQGILIFNSIDIDFIIRNCTFIGYSTPTNTEGIAFVNTTNGIIYNNTLRGHGADGIFLYINSDDNYIVENRIINNTKGIYLNTECRNNIIKGNFLNNNTFGIHFSNALIDSSHNAIINNILIENKDRGIFIENCSWNDIVGNMVIGDYPQTVGEGIYLKNSNNNDIHKNTAKNNTYGLRLEESSYNCIYENILVNNAIQDYNETGTCIGNGDCSGTPILPGDDDDDDDDEVDNTIVIVLIIVFVSIGAGIVIIIILIKKGIKVISKQRS